MGFAVAQLTLATAVGSPAGTVAFAYPSGTIQADFTGANASATAYLILNGNDRFEEADDDFDISYGASTVTVTNKTGASWAVGTRLTVNLANQSPVSVEDLKTAGPVASIGGALTGTTDGTMADVADIALSTSNTYTDAAVNAAVNGAIVEINRENKELQVKVNEILVALRATGIILTS